MARLIEQVEILTQVGKPDHDAGVTFTSNRHLASTVTLNTVRWLEMGQPSKILVEISLVK